MKCIFALQIEFAPRNSHRNLSIMIFGWKQNSMFQEFMKSNTAANEKCQTTAM